MDWRHAGAGNRHRHHRRARPPHLFTVRTFLSKVGFEPVSLCSRGDDVSEGGLDLLRVPAPSASIALDPVPCHLLQLAGIEEYPQEFDKPAQLCPHPPTGPHEIPNIEEALRDLIQGLLAIARIGFLQNPLAYKARQLG